MKDNDKASGTQRGKLRISREHNGRIRGGDRGGLLAEREGIRDAVLDFKADLVEINGKIKPDCVIDIIADTCT